MKDKFITKYVPSYFYEFRPPSSVQTHKFYTVIPPPRLDIKDHQNKGIKKKSPHVKCDKCQCYGHIVDKCTNLFRVIIIDGVSTTASKPDSTIFLKVTPVIKELVIFSQLKWLLSLLLLSQLPFALFSFPALLLPTPTSSFICNTISFSLVPYVRY